MADYYAEEDDYGEQGEQEYAEYAKPKLSNSLPVWGNQRTMNINNLVLTNIQASPYFKVKLYGLKTYHEVIDEIYYKIDHLEPWERGSRKTAGQTGMCGGVRGVGTGGIVSTSFCILYKLFTLKLTRKQLNGMLNHVDSPYIRALGLMYIRFCQPPKDLYDWFEPYFEDEEELDVKAGGGCIMTIGQITRTILTKLDWFDTLFPRIPVPVQKIVDEKLRARALARRGTNENNGKDCSHMDNNVQQEQPNRDDQHVRSSSQRDRSSSKSSRKEHSRSSRERDGSRDRKRSKRSHSRERHSRNKKRHNHSPHSKHSKRSRSRERRRSRSKDRSHRYESKRSKERSRGHSHKSR